MKKLFTIAILFMTMNSMQAQTALPTTAKCVSEEGALKLYLNLESKATENEPANVMSVIQLPSNSGLVGFVCEDDAYIVMQSYRYHPDPEVGGRFPVLLVYDLNGKFFKELSLQK